MALAADLVIVEVDEIVEPGEIPYDQVGTPGILVDIIVQGNTLDERFKYYEDMWVATKANEINGRLLKWIIKRLLQENI